LSIAFVFLPPARVFGVHAGVSAISQRSVSSASRNTSIVIVDGPRPAYVQAMRHDLIGCQDRHKVTWPVRSTARISGGAQRQE
jgi:hypothetical protein